MKRIYSLMLLMAILVNIKAQTSDIYLGLNKARIKSMVKYTISDFTTGDELKVKGIQWGDNLCNTSNTILFAPDSLLGVSMIQIIQPLSKETLYRMIKQFDNDFKVNENTWKVYIGSNVFKVQLKEAFIPIEGANPAFWITDITNAKVE